MLKISLTIAYKNLNDQNKLQFGQVSEQQTSNFVPYIIQKKKKKKKLKYLYYMQESDIPIHASDNIIAILSIKDKQMNVVLFLNQF